MRRWQIPIVLPALLALTLVVGLAVQSGRAVQVHRRAVALALRDYAAFATWQYTRRASDYLRLTIITQLSERALSPGQVRLRGEAVLSGVVNGGRVDLDGNHEHARELSDAFALALEHSARSRLRIGLIPLGDPNQHRYLGYAFRNDTAGRVVAAQGIVLETRDLLPVFDHVASFAPLLPPVFVGSLPNDSLVSVKIVGADGVPITVIGRDIVDGITANDVLGPDLGDVRVVATLTPIATRRLVAGGMPSSNTRALVAMLGVTLVLCVVAVHQMRRTSALIRLRDDFVTSVSHELKTPLTQISLFADTLASPRERPMDEQRQYLTIISREATRLGQLVDGILHFAGMTRPIEGAASSREASLLGEEIRAAVAAFEPIADARSVTIQTRIDDATLTSPVTGRVLYRLAEAGEVLPAGGKALTLVNLEDVYMEIFLPAEQASQLKVGAEGRIAFDYAPGRSVAGVVTFVSPEAQFTPKEVETRSEREKLMFRVKISVPKELVLGNIERIKTGVRGVGYVKVDPSVTWPAWLRQDLVPAKTAAK